MNIYCYDNFLYDLITVQSKINLNKNAISQMNKVW